MHAADSKVWPGTRRLIESRSISRVQALRPSTSTRPLGPSYATWAPLDEASSAHARKVAAATRGVRTAGLIESPLPLFLSWLNAQHRESAPTSSVPLATVEGRAPPYSAVPVPGIYFRHANRRAGSASLRGRVPDSAARQNRAARRLGGPRAARAARLVGRHAARSARS